MTAEVLLLVTGLDAGYDGSQVLQGIDMTVNTGEIVAVIGRNGVGKTTLMRSLIGLIRGSAGSIVFKDVTISGMTADARAHLGIGYIPQGRDVFPRMSVEENLQVGELINGSRAGKLYDLVYDLFPLLKERRNQQAGTMSGGEQQQLVIGRALIGNPSLMLLDEPSEGIQPSIVDDICRAMTTINKELGTTILFVEQNLDMIIRLSQRCYVMEKGRIIAEISSDDLREPAVVRSYLQV